MVDIVIPIYKTVPDDDDLISLRQVFNVLNRYEITFIHPENLDISAYKSFGKCNFKSFENFYFQNIFGYNQLLLSKNLYESFTKKYILIYQTDAFVFKDDLMIWLEKDYDYIGAPWLRSKERIPIVKMFWDKIIFFLKCKVNYKNNGIWQKDKSLLYNEVGNGGFSLRKREKFIEILNMLPQVVDVYLSPKNQGSFYAEDVFYSIEPKRNNLNFKKPNYKEACQFAIENKQDKALKYNEGKLPFACHRWNKERSFWRKYFDEYGYKI